MPWDIRIRAEDKLGRLWIQYNREFHVIDIRTRKKIQPDNISQLGKIKDVGTNWNNKLLIINTQGELWVENSANGWTKLCSLPDKHTYFASSKFRGSSIWLVSKQSDDGHMDFIALNPTGKLISRTHIRYVISGAWFTLDNDELLLVNRETYGRLSPNGDLRSYPINLDLTNETLPYINTWVAYDHDSQRLWINHRGKFKIYALEGGNAIRIPELQDVHHIFRMYHDDAGNLWVGTITGIYRIRLNTIYFTKINYRNQDEGQYDFSQSSRAIVPWSANIMYFVSGHKLWRYQRDNEATLPVYDKVAGITDIAVDTINRAMWFLTDKLVKFSPEKQSEERFNFPDRFNRGATFCLHQDRDELWIFNSTGISYFDKKQGTFRDFNQYNGYESLRYSETYHVENDGPDAWWILTNNGLFYKQRHKGITKAFGTKGKGRYYLPVNNFRHMLRDTSG